MSTPVEVTVGSPPPGTCFTTVRALMALVSNLVSAELDAGYTTHVRGSSTPGPDDQDKLWARTTEDGKPLGWFKFYNGNWRRIQDVRPWTVRAYYPTAPVPNDDFDDDGVGVIGGQWDGFVLLDGKDGRINMAGRTILGVGGDYELGDDGGAKEVKLTLDQVPREAQDAVALGKCNANGNDNVTTWENCLYGMVGTAGSTEILPKVDGNDDPDVVPTLPPYRVMYFARFVGY